MKKKNIILRLIVGACIGILIGVMMEREDLKQMAGANEKLIMVLSIAAGVICGICLAGVAVLIIRKLGGKVGGSHMEGAYDERQLEARGQAYKAAYNILVWYMAVISLLSEMAGMSWFMSFSGICLGICLSVLVFVVFCIIKDAYMSLYDNAKGILMLCSFVGIINLAIGIKVLLDREPLLVNGKLSSRYINLILGIVFCIVVITFLGKIIYNRKHREEDEE